MVRQDMALKALPQLQNFLTSQKLLLSKTNIQNFNLRVSRYVVITYLNSRFICKIYERDDITDNFCYIDMSVQFIQPVKENLSSQFLIRKDSVREVSNIYSFKCINIDIIFNTLDQSVRWKSDQKLLTDILKKHVFKMFVISENCKLNLANVSFLHRLGLKEIIINSGDFGLNCNIKDVLILGKVTNGTKIKISNLYSYLEYNHITTCHNIKQVIGLQNEFEKLIDIININKYILSTKQSTLKPLKQILIIGPAGTGKTTLVYAVAAKMKVPIVSMHGSELFKQDPGESEKEVRNIFSKAIELSSQNVTCILLLDGLENICPRASHNSGVHISRVSTQLLSLLDEAHSVPALIIIGITNNSRLLHPCIRRPGRMDIEIHIRLPNEFDRHSMFEHWVRDLFPENYLSLFDMQDLCKEASSVTPGYNGSDIELICQKVLLHMNRKKNLPHNSPEWKRLFRIIIQNSYPSSSKEYLAHNLTHNQLTLNSIGGSTEIVEILRRSIEWPIRHPEIFRRMGIAQQKGLLMYGPPGCAKTSLACAIAKEINFCFYNVSAAQLYSPYVGVAEATLVSIFQQARQNAPSIVFIDEIDSIIGKRSHGFDNHNEVQNRLLSTLLMEIDGVGTNFEYRMKTDDLNDGNTAGNSGIFLIAATNRPDSIDSALMRPGRFDRVLYIPPPNEKSRLDILKIITSKVPLDVDVNLEKIAFDTVQYSGADIVKLCKEAILEAMTCEGLNISRIKVEYFKSAFSNNKPSLSKSQISWYEDFKI